MADDRIAMDPPREDSGETGVNLATGAALRERVDQLVTACEGATSRIRAALGPLTHRPAPRPLPPRDEVLEAELRAAQEALVSARADAAGLKDALDAARERQAALVAASTSGDAARHELRARIDQDEALRQALDATQGRLAALEQSTVPLAEKERLERRERELMVRSGLLGQRLAELERHAEENALLRSRVRELEALRQRATVLEARVRAAQARGGIPAEPAAPPTSVGSAGEPSPLVGATVAGTLESGLLQVLETSRGISAVLADQRGFPLVGVGDRAHHEALEVLTSLAQELARQTTDLLPLGAARSVDVQGTGQAAVRVRLFSLGDEVLGLALLGPTEARDERAEDDALVHFTHILAARGPSE
jgi:hypothetical protein